MNITSMREGESVTTNAAGMVQIEAVRLGSSTNVGLTVTGNEVQTNPMSDSALKLTWLRGRADISLRPVGQDVFPPGTHVQVVVSQGRQNTPAYVAWELPTVTLDGRTELLIGQLEQGDAKLTISAVAAKFDARLGREAETIRAALRSKMSDIRLTEDLGFTVVLDASASMSAPATQRYLSTAADVIKGMADELAPGMDLEFVLPGQAPLHVEQAKITEALTDGVAAGRQRIGGAETIPARMNSFVVVVSDQAPALVSSGKVNALALVLGDEARPQRYCVPVNGSLASSLAAGQIDTIDATIREIVTVAQGLSLNGGAANNV